MALLSTAGVEFIGSVMRYSEIEHDDSNFKLLRLGNCEFEFDAWNVVFNGESPSHLKTIRSAIQDVFQGTHASFLRFVVPSARLNRFTSVLPSGSSDDSKTEQIAFETSLLSENGDSGDVFPEPLYSHAGSGVERYSVSHVDSSISENLKALGQAFPTIPVHIVPSTSAAFLAFRHVAHRLSLRGSTYLLVGSYAESTDFVLVKNGQSQVQHYARTPFPEDVAYQALLLANRNGLSFSDISEVFVYGQGNEEALISILEEAFGPIVHLFNPSPVVNLDEDRFEADFPIQAFVPSIGAAVQ